MSKFTLSGPQLPRLKAMDHQKKLIFIGSCFSENMAALFHESGFRVNFNPLGTAYHPLILARQLTFAISGDPHFFPLADQGLSYDWLTGHQLVAPSREQLESELKLRYQTLHADLSEASHLFITFGTAFVYRLLSHDLLVANCHKQPSNLFQKELSQVDDLVLSWKNVLLQIKENYPDLEIVFTVSPVRHVRDGLTQNNRSKARLFELLTRMEEQGMSSLFHYFPAYEIVMDELRDYRFFDDDLIHPNHLAIRYVWEKLTAQNCTEKTLILMQEVRALRKLAAHRSRDSFSELQTKFKADTDQKIQDFLAANPEVNW